MSSRCPLRPIWGRVVIRQAVAPLGTKLDAQGRHVTSGGILIPHGGDRGNQTREGTVLAVGPGQPHHKQIGVRWPMFDLKPGDYVFFKTAEEVTIDGAKLLITDVGNIDGVLEEDGKVAAE